MVKKFTAEAFGTAILVFFACGVATLTFGVFSAKTSGLNGFTGWSNSAGVVATALTFGLVLAGLCYAIGPISGSHVNPAVTLGALLARRVTLAEAVTFWVAQFVGATVGAFGLWLVLKQSPAYRFAYGNNAKSTGLGADGYGPASWIHIHAAGALMAEVAMTAIFVYVILVVTAKAHTTAVTGLAIGLTLTMVHLFGIAIDGTSVNPARSFGPALLLGGQAFSQLWVFIVGPLLGGALAAGVYVFFHGRTVDA